MIPPPAHLLSPRSKSPARNHVSIEDDRPDNHTGKMGEDEPARLPDGRQFYSPSSLIGSRDRSVAWYDKTFSGVPADARELLEKYSKIPPDEVESHVLSMVCEDYSHAKPASRNELKML